MDDDAAIIELCQRGRPEGAARMLLGYQEQVYRRAYSLVHHREDALDLTQEVFLRAFQGVGTFTPGRPIWPWLRRITTNQCLNYLRRRPQLLSLDEAWEHGTEPRVAPGSGASDPATALAATQDRDELAAALARLPPLHRMAVVLRHQEGLSYDQVAQAMGLPLGTVKTHLFRARRALRAALGRGEGPG